MAVTIGSNISSLRTIRQLDATTRNLASTSERLASGQRINRASDDAAGLAIASSLDAASRIFTKALSNVNDGISLLSITDGAMRELGTILTRVKELATQSANGSYSPVQRRALDEEGQKLRDEYNRILATTTFNGVKTLDGSQTSVTIQAGSDGMGSVLQLAAPSLKGISRSLSFDGTDHVSIADSASLSFGAGGTDQAFSISAWIKADSLTGYMAIASKGPVSLDSSREWGMYIDPNGNLGVALYDNQGGQRIGRNDTSNTITTGTWYHVAMTYDASETASGLKLFVNGTQVDDTNDNSGSYAGMNSTASPVTIGHIAANVYADGQIDDLRIYNRTLGSSEVVSLAGGSALSTGLVAHYNFEEGSGSSANDSSGYGNHGTLTNGPSWSSDAPSALNGSSAGLETFSLLTASDARSAMDTIESAFSRLSGEVGKLGSQLSRLQTVINTIAASRENYQAAAGRIKDADVAQESANLVRHEILQQTASGVLAQANQQPQIAIQLLGAI